MSNHIYRVDNFIVPDDAREEFLSKVTMTHDLLKTLPGFVRDAILDKTAGDGEFNLVTIVEWESDDAIQNARDAVQALHREMNFNPQELMSRLNIKMDRGNYTPVSA